jgi:Tetracyclin repressor-like, C-terminal domain
VQRGERLARAAVRFWDDPVTGGPLLALLRSAASQESSATLLREFMSREVLGRLATALDLTDAPARAGLAASQIVGLAMSRYVLRMEPLASADPETVVAYLGPTLQRYLTGDLPAPRQC